MDVAGSLELPKKKPKVTTINTALTGAVGHNFACPCRSRSRSVIIYQDISRSPKKSLKCLESFWNVLDHSISGDWICWVIFGYVWFMVHWLGEALPRDRGHTSVRTECGMDQLRKVGVLGGRLDCNAASYLSYMMSWRKNGFLCQSGMPCQNCQNSQK